MPEGKHKSRTYRREKVTTPGKRHVTHYIKRKPQSAHCSVCGAVLMGTLRERPYKMMTTAKTKKRPQRPFGGVLCSKCSRLMIVSKSRS